VTPSGRDARLGDAVSKAVLQTVVTAIEKVLMGIGDGLCDEISKAAHEISTAQDEISQQGNEISNRGDEISSRGNEISRDRTEISSHENEISRGGVEISSGGDSRRREGCRDSETGRLAGLEISSEISSAEIEISRGDEISSEISSEIARHPKPLNAKAVADILRNNPDLLHMRGKDLAAVFGVTPVVITRARKLVAHG